MLTRSSLLAGGLLAVAAVLAGLALLVSNQAQAAPPPAVTFRDATTVRDTGQQIGLPGREVGDAVLVEPRTASGDPAPPLAVSPDGSIAAFARVAPGQVGPLVLAHADGSQLELALPGASGAAFAPSGAWLAVVDGTGALWRVDGVSGAAVRLGDGPYAADPSIPNEDQILAVRLSSVEAPTWAAAELVDPASGASIPIDPTTPAEEQLVYGASALLDGSVSLVRHRVGGGVAVLRVSPGSPPVAIANLEAPTVAVSPTGEWLAWTASDRVLIAPGRSPGKPTDLGPGRAARFAPDGGLVLVTGARSTAVFDLDGGVVAEASVSACWAGDGRGCRP